MLILYNAWPDRKGPETWEQRFVWLGRYVCCQCSRSQTQCSSCPVSQYVLMCGACAAGQTEGLHTQGSQYVHILHVLPLR